MLTRLTLATIAFHLINLAGLTLVVRSWKHRYLDRPGTPARLGRLTVDGVLLGLLAAPSALLFGQAFHLGGFGVLNLAAQWVFVEFLILLGTAALLLRTAGSAPATGLTVLLSFGLIAVGIDAYYVEPNALDVHEHVVPRTAEREQGARRSPPHELRIVHLSDIQTASIGDHERRAFREACAQEPDLIVLTGDYIHALPGIEDEETARAQLRELINSSPRPRLGIYAVKGDTEGAAWPSMFAGTRVVTLTDDSVRVPLPDEPTRQLSLLGLSPQNARGSDRHALRRAVRSLPDADLKVIIGHSPDYVMQLEPGTVDLAMGGHTHGGQIALPFFGAPITLSRLPRTMARGLHDWAGTPVHVSAGVGMERHFAPQIRFLCRPEVCLLRVPL